MTAGHSAQQATCGRSRVLHTQATPQYEIRVGILCHGMGSGSARAAFDLAYGLHRRGLAVVLITLGSPRWKLPPDLPRALITQPGFPQGVEAKWGATDIDRLARSLSQLCRMHRLSVLHYHYAFPFAEAAARLAATSVSPPHIVATLHGGDIVRAANDPSWRARLASALAQSGVICSVSRAYAARLQELTGLDCLVVPNFLPPERTAPPRTAHGIGSELTIVHASNFRAVKNVQHIGQVFLGLRRFRNCRLLLVGDGPHRPALQTMLRGCGGSVRFFGMLDAVQPVIGMADVMLLASQSESFSLAALEAMSAGVPVIAPRVAGLSETVGDGTAGILFAPGRPWDAVLKLLRLSNSPHRYRSLSRAAHRSACAYTETATVEVYLAIYDRLART